MNIKMKNKVCAGIVTFNPDIVLLGKNIRAIKDQVNQVVICDNGSKNLPAIKTRVNEIDSNIIIIELKENFGIAYALNIICRFSQRNQYEWALTLDQDSICPICLVQELLKYANLEMVGVVSPNVAYANNEEFINKKQNAYEFVTWNITSASLTNINVWDLIGGFDESYFIDKVDLDYCISYQAGYKVIEATIIYT
jgi:rhamnosyltransferase